MLLNFVDKMLAFLPQGLVGCGLIGRGFGHQIYQKKMSKDIRLHDLGSQLSSPKSEITVPENHYRSNRIVSRSVYHVIPFC